MTPYDPTDTTPGLMAAIAHLGHLASELHAELRAELDRARVAHDALSAEVRDLTAELDDALRGTAQRRVYIHELEGALALRCRPEESAAIVNAAWAQACKAADTREEVQP
jgi:hypothetical protein